MFVRARRAAAVLAALALAAGCSGSGSSPRTLPSLDASTGSPSASPSPTSDSKRAVVQVVTEYYNTINDLRRVMDANALASLMTETCTCRQQVAAVRAAAAKHEHFIDHVTIKSLTPSMDGQSAADVLVEYDAGPGGLVDAAGTVVTHAAAKRGIRRVIHLQLVGPRWLISEIDAA